MTENLSLLWYQAQRAPLGLILRSNDRHALKQRLYAARREARDVELEGISIIMDPNHDDFLWLLKRKSDAPT